MSRAHLLSPRTCADLDDSARRQNSRGLRHPARRVPGWTRATTSMVRPSSRAATGWPYARLSGTRGVGRCPASSTDEFSHSSAVAGRPNHAWVHSGPATSMPLPPPLRGLCGSRCAQPHRRGSRFDASTSASGSSSRVARHGGSRPSSCSVLPMPWTASNCSSRTRSRPADSASSHSQGQ